MAARPPPAPLALGLALLAAAAAAARDPFAPQLGDTGACHARCGRSPARRDAADAALNACHRGCRLFSICHFVDAGAGLDATRAQCEAACAEAYGRAEEQRGCARGCRHQQLPPQRRPHQSPAPLSVLDLLSSLCSGIVSSAHGFISSTWTFSLQADDGKVVVFQSQPELEYPVPEQPERMERPRPGAGPRAGAWGSGVTGGTAGGGSARAQCHLPPGTRQRGRDPAGGRAEPPPPERDLLGCVSKRSGLPRWLLAACLLLAVAAMLWLSCATLVTAPEQRGRTRPLGAQEGPAGAAALPPVLAVPLLPAHDAPQLRLDKTLL
ncbi:LOW QUALITY PROTEIN: transmembrane protein 59-like [Eudromia elegans]